MNHRHAPLELPASLDACAPLMDELARNITALQMRVDLAKSQAAADGHYADNHWFHRASAALRYLKRDRQRLQDHMGALRRAERQAVASAHDQVLLGVLRELVDDETFSRAIAEAKARKGAAA